jgi:hypothetical protein
MARLPVDWLLWAPVRRNIRAAQCRMSISTVKSYLQSSAGRSRLGRPAAPNLGGTCRTATGVALGDGPAPWARERGARPSHWIVGMTAEMSFRKINRYLRRPCAAHYGRRFPCGGASTQFPMEVSAAPAAVCVACCALHVATMYSACGISHVASRMVHFISHVAFRTLYALCCTL